MDAAKSCLDPASSIRNASRHRLRRVIGFCLTWKLFLISLAVCSPGQGYDTSTYIVLQQGRRDRPTAWIAQLAERLALRLTRWDAIYFTSASAGGQVYEQEWAFRSLFSELTSGVERGA